MSKSLNTILIAVTLFIYVYGYKIAKLFYNATGLTGEERKEVIHNFWQFRLGMYALIIAAMYYIAKQELTKLQKALVNIGLSFALFSAFDKIVLIDFNASKYDKLFVFMIIILELYKYKRK